MTTAPQDALAPIALGPGEGEHLWFFGGLTTIKADGAGTGGRVMVTEQPRRAAAARRCTSTTTRTSGSTSSRASSRSGSRARRSSRRPARSCSARATSRTRSSSAPSEARFLLVTEPAGFEGFIRALAAPAAAPEIPPAPTAPPDMEPVLRAAADHGLEILGPPGIPA